MAKFEEEKKGYRCGDYDYSTIEEDVKATDRPGQDVEIAHQPG